MAKETKTVQCYPSDAKINETCARYGAFGWELIGNQRCEEDKGTYDGYRHWTTFNKLTFTREKTTPWYDEVTKLEREHDELMDSEPGNYAIKPSKYWLLFAIFGIAIGIVMTFALGKDTPIEIICVGIGLIVAGAIFFVVFVVKSVHYKRDTDDYYSRLREWRNTSEKKAEEIRKKAEKIVNA